MGEGIEGLVFFDLNYLEFRTSVGLMLLLGLSIWNQKLRFPIALRHHSIGSNPLTNEVIYRCLSSLLRKGQVVFIAGSGIRMGTEFNANRRIILQDFDQFVQFQGCI